MSAMGVRVPPLEPRNVQSQGHTRNSSSVEHLSAKQEEWVQLPLATNLTSQLERFLNGLEAEVADETPNLVSIEFDSLLARRHASVVFVGRHLTRNEDQMSSTLIAGSMSLSSSGQEP
jgi:hypothetical protein